MALNQPLASVIIPSWNGRHLIGPCLESLGSQTYPHFEVIVVDGGSTDGSVEVIARQYPHVRTVALEANYGFSGNVNAGLRSARGEILALLNNDAEADPAWLSELVAGLQSDPRAGSCASKILHADERQVIASAGDLLGRDGLAAERGNGQVDTGQFDQPGEAFAASGGAAAYRRHMLDDVGLFDERYVSYIEDVDLGLRSRLRGWGCRYVPSARVYHRGSATGGGELASFYVARNSIRLVARCFPSGVLRACYPLIIRAQLQRTRSAALAWRGKAARATLRGQIAGLRNLPHALRSRRQIQATRLLSDPELMALLT